MLNAGPLFPALHDGGLRLGLGGAPLGNLFEAISDAQATAVIEAVCDEFEVPLRAAALQFPLGHAAIEIVMVGARSAAQWADNVAMLARPIPAAFRAALVERGLLPR